MANIFRLLVQAITLTGSDLSSSSKLWPEQEKTSEIIYKEFYEQVKKIHLKNKITVFFMDPFCFISQQHDLMEMYQTSLC